MSELSINILFQFKVDCIDAQISQQSPCSFVHIGLINTKGIHGLSLKRERCTPLELKRDTNLLGQNCTYNHTTYGHFFYTIVTSNLLNFTLNHIPPRNNLGFDANIWCDAKNDRNSWLWFCSWNHEEKITKREKYNIYLVHPNWFMSTEKGVEKDSL